MLRGQCAVGAGHGAGSLAFESLASVLSILFQDKIISVISILKLKTC